MSWRWFLILLFRSKFFLGSTYFLSWKLYRWIMSTKIFNILHLLKLSISTSTACYLRNLIRTYLKFFLFNSKYLMVSRSAFTRKMRSVEIICCMGWPVILPQHLIELRLPVIFISETFLYVIYQPKVHFSSNRYFANNWSDSQWQFFPFWYPRIKSQMAVS